MRRFGAGLLVAVFILAGGVLSLSVTMQLTTRGAFLLTGLATLVCFALFLLGISIFKHCSPDNSAERIRGLNETIDHLSFFSHIVDHAAIPFAAWSSEGKILFCNQAFLAFTGYSPEDLNEKNWRDHFVPRERHETEAHVLQEMQRTGQPQLYEQEILCKDGYRVPAELTLHQILNESDTASCYYAFIVDSTERKKAQKEREQVNKDLSNYIKQLEQYNRETLLIGEMSTLLQASVTVQETHQVIAKYMQRLFSSESGIVYQLNVQKNMLEPIVQWGSLAPEDRVATPGECWALRLGRPYTADKSHAEMLCPHMQRAPENAFFCVPMIAQGETLGLLQLQFSGQSHEVYPEEIHKQLVAHKQQIAVSIAKNVALSFANFKLREKLVSQSIQDPLTGLFNRRHMMELLEKELQRMSRKGQPLAVIMLDIDHFKTFNDNYGHEAGDLVLRELGVFLQERIRSEDFACRYGGEEFILILPETTIISAKERAEQLRAEVRHHSVTISLGVAAFPKHGLTVGDLLRAADTALYQAKAEGRDRAVVL